MTVRESCASVHACVISKFKISLLSFYSTLPYVCDFIPHAEQQFSRNQCSPQNLQDASFTLLVVMYPSSHMNTEDTMIFSLVEICAEFLIPTGTLLNCRCWMFSHRIPSGGSNSRLLGRQNPDQWRPEVISHGSVAAADLVRSVSEDAGMCSVQSQWGGCILNQKWQAAH